ncbi:hypothetical protein GUITHDRAFT_132015 [Guillardia theta CCMP2712]|uniref:Uncharacterized protein n=1 Tax=Guillardia theta (strain CCMP2712) TaxID=905079 RepID=L1K2M8_GUITC|nr:hypothetical protein GUITHDRAFT_132015 [Guillardia theta CCMP2712]EKX55086.1 hypothetical protein GUITHDRAFT_132015 [Guillardia theta CCMP2712]|eukprot:XP_005842066.1 hypothetical protein GUITHDRAFT_132015 [Guillardia theta CCMP2712]
MIEGEASRPSAALQLSEEEFACVVRGSDLIRKRFLESEREGSFDVDERMVEQWLLDCYGFIRNTDELFDISFAQRLIGYLQNPKIFEDWKSCAERVEEDAMVRDSATCQAQMETVMGALNSIRRSLVDAASSREVNEILVLRHKIASLAGALTSRQHSVALQEIRRNLAERSERVINLDEEILKDFAVIARLRNMISSEFAGYSLLNQSHELETQRELELASSSSGINSLITAGMALGIPQLVQHCNAYLSGMEGVPPYQRVVVPPVSPSCGRGEHEGSRKNSKENVSSKYPTINLSEAFATPTSKPLKAKGREMMAKQSMNLLLLPSIALHYTLPLNIFLMRHILCLILLPVQYLLAMQFLLFSFPAILVLVLILLLRNLRVTKQLDRTWHLLARTTKTEEKVQDYKQAKQQQQQTQELETQLLLSDKRKIAERARKAAAELKNAKSKEEEAQRQEKALKKEKLQMLQMKTKSMLQKNLLERFKKESSDRSSRADEPTNGLDSEEAKYLQHMRAVCMQRAAQRVQDARRKLEAKVSLEGFGRKRLRCRQKREEEEKKEKEKWSRRDARLAKFRQKLNIQKMFQPGARPDSSDALDGKENESDGDRDRKEESSELSEDEDAISHSSRFSDVSSDASPQRMKVEGKGIDPDYAKFYTRLFEMAQEHKEEENCNELMDRSCQAKAENKQEAGSTDDSTEEEIVRLIEETRNGSNRMDGEGWIINSAS